MTKYFGLFKDKSKSFYSNGDFIFSFNMLRRKRIRLWLYDTFQSFKQGVQLCVK